MIIEVLAAFLVVLIVLGIRTVRLISRLDRLHIRTDAAWAALDAALARRALLARLASPALKDATQAAEAAPRTGREAAENEVSKLLGELDRAELPTGFAAELADAEHRMVLARRVHNDAVRDTRALRGKRSVRWPRLAGTAPLPAYFEIAEPVDAVSGQSALVPRASARILLVDDQRRVLLFRGGDRPPNDAEQLWFTPGGGVEGCEHLRATAVRELAEETGVRCAESDLVGPVWLRRAMACFGGSWLLAEEWFFLLRTASDQVDTSGFTALENVYPPELGELLVDLLTREWDGTIRAVG